MKSENIKPVNSNSKHTDLDEYMQDIKSRNNRKSETIIDDEEEKKKEKVISTKEDLYDKIIKESHNMRSEILSNNKNKINSTNVKFSDSSYNQDGASILFSRNINRALIFQSTENINKDSKNENYASEKSELLSPIVNITDVKSGFNTLNKLYNGTDTKVAKKFNNSNQKISNETDNYQNYITDTNSLPVTNQGINNYSRRINAGEKFSSNAKDLKLKNATNSTNPVSPIDDFQILYLINNCKQIEKMIEDNRPGEIIEKFEDKISKNFLELDNMKKDELEIVEMKHEIEIKLQEVKSLCKMFQEKLASLEYFLSSKNNTPEECEKCKNKKSEDEQYQNRFSFSNANCTFDNYLKNNSMHIKNKRAYTFNDVKIVSEYSLQILKEKKLKNNLYSDFTDTREENSNDDCDKSKTQEEFPITNINSRNISTYGKNENTSQNYDSMIIDSKNINKRNLQEISDNINYYLSNSMIKEATECWKKIKFMPLENCSFERSYEMLAQIMKINEREKEILNRRNFVLEKQAEETKKKDIEIVHLFAQLESSRNRACELEENSKELTRVKTKMNNLINDNSTLYKENVRLKLMLKDAEYRNMKTNSETLISSNHSLIENYYYDNNSKLKKENFN